MTDKATPDDEVVETSAAQRLDKWLWYIRIVKSRTMAAGLVTNGKVRVNRQKIDKPSYLLKPGDVVTLSVRGKIRVVEVVAAGTRRGPASEAASLYIDLTEPDRQDPTSSDPTQDTQAAVTTGRSPGTGRPTKRDRRLLDQLRRNDRKI